MKGELKMGQEHNSGNGGNSQRTSSNEGMQQVLEAGAQASKLLESPIYNQVYQMQINDIFAQWLSTEPKEERRRESLWHQAQGLKGSAEAMGGMVKYAKTLLDEQSKSHEARESAALDTQGFGLDF